MIRDQHCQRKLQGVQNGVPLKQKNALKLHFACGPTGYKELLCQGYPLPSHRTLSRPMHHVKFDSGILGEVFHYLAIKASSMKVEKRECCLILDEMLITASVEFDIPTGGIMGDVTLPGHSGAATHGLVFMLGGLATRWKQTVAYYFTSNATDGSVSADIVKQIIIRCHGIGLNVAAAKTDMGSSNRVM
jgi:Transposase protein